MAHRYLFFVLTALVLFQTARGYAASPEIESIGVKSVGSTHYSEHIWQHFPRDYAFDYLTELPPYFPAILHKEFVDALLLKAAPLPSESDKRDFYETRLRKLIDLGAYEAAERLYEAHGSKEISDNAHYLGILASLYLGKFDKICLYLKTDSTHFTQKDLKEDISYLCEFWQRKENAPITEPKEGISKELLSWITHIVSKQETSPAIVLNDLDKLPEHIRAIAVSQELLQISLEREDTKIRDLNNHALWLYWNMESNPNLSFTEAEMLDRGLITKKESKIPKGKYLKDAIASRIKTSIRFNSPSYLLPVLDSASEMDLSDLPAHSRLQLHLSRYLFEDDLKAYKKDKTDKTDIAYILSPLISKTPLESPKIKAWYESFCTKEIDVNQSLCLHIILNFASVFDKNLNNMPLTSLFYDKKNARIFLTNYVIPLYIYTDLSRKKDNKEDKLDLSLLKLLHYSRNGLHTIAPRELRSVLNDIIDYGEKDFARVVLINAVINF